MSLLETRDYFSTSNRIVDLYARGASDPLGILWETLHTYRYGESGVYTWRQLGTRVRCVHVKDSAKCSPDGFDQVLTVRSPGADGSPDRGIPQFWHSRDLG